MSLFKTHARDIYQGQMPLEALSRTCGPDVIYYTHFNLKKKIDLYTPHVIHKDLNITVIGQVEDALQ